VSRKEKGENGTAGGQGEPEGRSVGDVPRNDLENIQRAQGEAGKDTGSIDEACRVFNQACDAYRDAYNNIAKAHDLVLKISWLETSRLKEWKIVGRAQTLGKNDKLIEGHILVVKYARDLDHYSTEHVRKFLKLQTPETRTLQLVVLNHLWPIYDLDGEQFWVAFWQCFACMFFLQVSWSLMLTRSSQVTTGSG